MFIHLMEAVAFGSEVSVSSANSERCLSTYVVFRPSERDPSVTL